MAQKKAIEIPEDLEVEILNEEQRRYRFYEDNATASIKELEKTLLLQKELLKFFKKRVIETADKNESFK